MTYRDKHLLLHYFDSFIQYDVFGSPLPSSPFAFRMLYSNVFVSEITEEEMISMICQKQFHRWPPKYRDQRRRSNFTFVEKSLVGNFLREEGTGRN